MIYVYIGVIFSKKGFEPKWSIQYYDKALNYDPNNFDAHLNKGIEFIDRLENKAQAKKCFDIAINLKKENPKINYYMGLYYLQTEEPKQCKFHFIGALEKSSHDLYYYHKICNQLLEHREYALASYFTKEGLKHHKGDERLQSIMSQIEKR